MEIVVTRALALLFRTYRLLLSPAIELGFGVRCRFEESCSCYMERALREHGFYKGFKVGIKRLASCNRFFEAN